jgi:hypothetical protein
VGKSNQSVRVGVMPAPAPRSDKAAAQLDNRAGRRARARLARRAQPAAAPPARPAENEEK